MNIIEYIKNKIKSEESEKEGSELIEKWSKILEEKKKSGEENPIDNTNYELLDKIEQSANPDKLAKEMIRRGFEDKNIPNKVVENLSLKIAESSEVSNSVIPNAINESEANVSDNSIGNIIKKVDFDDSEKETLLKNIDDDKIIEEVIRNELIILYKKCKGKTDIEVVDEIDRIMNNIKSKAKYDIDVSDLIEKVITKKMAENYYSELKQRTRIFAFSKIISIEEMFEGDFIDLVEKEYKLIEDERGPKQGRFDKEDLKKQMLIRIGKNVGYQYRKTNQLIIPQSENMKKITKEEEEYLLRAISSTCLVNLKNEDISSIKKQIRGVVQNEKTQEKMIVEQIRKVIKEKSIDINSAIELFTNYEKIKTILTMEEIGLLDEINSLPTEKREKSLILVSEAYENIRMNKIKDEIKKGKEKTESKEEKER